MLRSRHLIDKLRSGLFKTRLVAHIAVALNVLLTLYAAQDSPWQVQAAIAAAACVGLMLSTLRAAESLRADGTAAGCLLVLVAAQMLLLPDRVWPQLNALLTLNILSTLKLWQLPALGTVWIDACHLGADAVRNMQGLPMPHEPLFVHLLATTAVGGWLAFTTRQRRITEHALQEIDFLIHAMGKDEKIRLGMRVLRADYPTGKRLMHLLQRMEEVVGALFAAMRDVQSASGTLAKSGTELNARTDQTASELREAAMCLEQINVIVQASARVSTEARGLSTEATNKAHRGSEVIGQVVQTMQWINESSEKITSIVGAIDGIAFQTTLLALNAAIEAARAGTHGKGFSVVAAEVRGLALRTSEAAKEIKTLIRDSLSRVQEGTDLAHLAGDAMDEVVAAVARVSHSFENFTIDSCEHALGISSVTQSIKDLDSVTRQNAIIADSAHRVGTHLSEMACCIDTVLSSFNLGDIPTPMNWTTQATPPDLELPLEPSAKPEARPEPSVSTVEFF